MQEPQLLAPSREAHPCFRQKDSLDGALACAARLAELVERFSFARVGLQFANDAGGAGVFGMRELQGDGVGTFDLGDDKFDERPLDWDGTAERGELAGVNDEFLEERRDVHDETLSCDDAGQAGKEVEGAHGNGSGHFDGVGRASGDPDGTERRDDPDALPGADCHHAARCEDELVFRMVVLGDELAVLEFDRDAGDLGEQSAFAAGQDAVALFRHYLSQYREKEWRASDISS